MQRTIVIALSLIAVSVAAPLTATASHDGTTCEVTASEPTVSQEGYAVFVDDETLPDSVSVWIYEESNGIDGIQRHDSVHQDELCGHAGDTIVF